MIYFLPLVLLLSSFVLTGRFIILSKAPVSWKCNVGAVFVASVAIWVFGPEAMIFAASVQLILSVCIIFYFIVASAK